MWSKQLVETFVIGSVIVPLFTVVPSSDYDSAFSASASFRELLLVPSGGLDRFAIFCAPFASITALYGSLIGLSHLFDPFPSFCNYFCTIVVCVGSVVGEPTPFSFLGSFTLSSIWIRSVNDHLL
jgi:hypothetical protein